VQLILPVRDNQGSPFPQKVWETLKNTLVERYGGVTAYTRSPAEGVWAPGTGEKVSEDVFIIEVVVGDLEIEWWRGIRKELEGVLRQEKLVFRAVPALDLD
jgi:hypothetical protein